MSRRNLEVICSVAGFSGRDGENRMDIFIDRRIRFKNLCILFLRIKLYYRNAFKNTFIEALIIIKFIFIGFIFIFSNLAS